MGMAASQARYLGLTARKSNVEYEGQQVNQQRTALANESANMFAELSSLSVPTAPSSSDYTQTTYTFNNGVNDCTIANVASLSGDAQYNSTVTYYYTTQPYTGVATKRTDVTLTNKGTSTNPVYYLGTTKLTAYSDTDDQTAVSQIANDCPTTAVGTNYNANPKETSKIYKYSSGGTTYYVSTDEAGANPVTTCYAANIAKKNTTTEKAYVQKEASGRYSSIQLASTSATFDLNATSTTDTNAYNDAMNDYNYRTTLYQQQVNAINAKTSTIQEEDRTLELRLRQLDTEQQALSTEMDSVKKVIDKNIESTFKTFSS